MPGAYSTTALGIDGSNIVGEYETPNGQMYGFLATAVPEPSALALLSLGVAAFFLGRDIRSKPSRPQ